MLVIDILLFFIVVSASACIGSFLGMASYRIPINQDIVFRDSYCPNCKKNLQKKSLIPILSWIIQKGKCNFCGNPISKRYIIIEILTTFILTLYYIYNGFNLGTLYFWILFSVAFLIIIIDIEHYIIPDSLQVIMLFLSIIYILANPIDPLASFFSAIAYLLITYISVKTVELFKKTDVLGGGDLKLIATSGLFLGIKLMPFFFIATGIIGVIFGLGWKKYTKNKVFPFGPAIVVTLLLLLYFR